MLQNILEDPQGSSSSTATTKLTFMQKQKEEMTQLVDELNSSIRLNRQTISKMALMTDASIAGEDRQRTFREVINELNFENEKLRHKNQSLIEQVEYSQCNVLLQSQIREEAEVQFMTILKQYEQKILELRRSVQDKEFLLQDGGNKHDRKNSHYVQPKQEFMKNHSDHENLKEVCKKLAQQNGLLRKQNSSLSVENQQIQYKLRKLESIMESNVGYQSARGFHRHSRKNKSQEGLPFGKPHQSLCNKGLMSASTLDCHYTRNENVSSFKKLLFKYKQSIEILGKQLNAVQVDLGDLAQSNKILRQSNLHHQIDRVKLQNEINFLKNKNHQLAAIVTKKRVRRSESTETHKIDIIVKETIQDVVPMQNKKLTNTYLLHLKADLNQLCLNTHINANTKHLRRSRKGTDRDRSFSCSTDYILTAEVDGVQKYLNKKQSRHDQSKVQAFPFSLDYSMIENKSSPLTFADFRRKIKANKLTESFMMITEQILKA